MKVAYGSARWGPYQGGFYGLAQTGSNADGSPLYSCRVRYSPNPGTDYGYQPGKLVSDGTCHIAMGGGEVVQSPPFDVLYATGGGRPPYPYPPYPVPYIPSLPRVTGANVSTLPAKRSIGEAGDTGRVQAGMLGSAALRSMLLATSSLSILNLEMTPPLLRMIQDQAQ